MKHLLHLLALAMLLSSWHATQAATITFIDVYYLNGFSSNGKPISGPEINGQHFYISTVDPTAPEFYTSGGNDDILLILEYSVNGITYSVPGVLTERVGNTDALIFRETVSAGSSTILETGQPYLLLIPGSGWTPPAVGTQFNINNGQFNVADLNAILTAQNAQAAPVITSNGGDANAFVNLFENNTSVTTVTATTPNASPLPTYTYSISGGLDANRFSMNTSTGVLSFLNAPDFENPTDANQDNTYEVKVLVTDNLGKTDEQSIYLTITNTNENPVITSNGGGSTATVNTFTGTNLVTSIQVSDPDGNDNLSFALSGTDASLFEVNAQNQLVFANTPAVGSYTVSVTVTDDGGLTDVQTFTINVSSTDTSSPSVSLSASDTFLASGESTTITFQFSEPINPSTFDLNDVSASGGSLSNLQANPNDPSQYTATFTKNSVAEATSISIADGTYNDVSGNSNVETDATLNFTYDLVAPTSAFSSSTTAISYNQTIEVNLDFSEEVNGFSIGDLLVTNGEIVNLVQDDVDPTLFKVYVKASDSQTAPSLSLEDNSYTDLAGNLGTGASLTSLVLAPPAIDLRNDPTDDTGISATDNITNNPRPRIDGLANPSDNSVTLTIKNGATSYIYTIDISSTPIVDNSKAFTLDLASTNHNGGSIIPTLSEQIITVELTGTNSGIIVNDFLVDYSIANTGSLSVNALSTPNSSPTLSGGAELADDEKLSVVVNGVTYVQGDGYLTYNASTSSWTLDLPVSLAEGIYTVEATISDLAGNTHSGSNSLTINAKSTISDGDWHTAANWAGGIIPDAESLTQVNHNMSIASDNTAYSKTLVVGSSASITNEGTLNMANQGRVVLEVSNSSAAEIINTGTIDMPNSAEIAVRRSFTQAFGWTFISFPYEVSFNKIFLENTATVAQAGDVSNPQGGDQFYVMEYDGSARANAGTANNTNGLHWKVINSDNLGARKGYIIAVGSDITLDFVSGTGEADLFDSNSNSPLVSPAVAHGNAGSVSPVHQGWNLIGLPFPSAFEVSYLPSGNFYYAYNGLTYNTYEPDNGQNPVYQIPAFTSFFFQATSSDGLSFPHNGRVNAGGPNKSQFEYDEVSLVVEQGAYTDRTQIRLKEQANESYLIGEDAIKMMSMNGAVPQIWSLIDETPSSINSLPTDVKEVNLGIQSSASGELSIRLQEMPSSYYFDEVILVDLVLDKEINLSETGVYTFNAESGPINGRFKIRFEAGLIEQSEAGIRMAQQGKTIRLEGLKEASQVRIFNMNGKGYDAFYSVEDGQSVFIQTSGILILEVRNELQNERFKVFIPSN